MKRIHKFVICLLIVAMAVTILPNDLFVEAKSPFKDSVRIQVEELQKDEEFSVYFPYNIENIQIRIPPGLEHIGYENGCHIFKATDKLYNIEGELFYYEGYTESTIEGGVGESMGQVGTGDGSLHASWQDYKLGKVMWENGDDLLVAIRFLADKIDKSKPVTIIDKANSNITTEIQYIVYYVKEEGINKIDNGRHVDYEITNNEDGFECELYNLDQINEEPYVYEVYYKVPNVKNLSNNYIIKQTDNIIEQGGYITAENINELPPTYPDDKDDEQNDEDLVEDNNQQEEENGENEIDKEDEDEQDVENNENEKDDENEDVVEDNNNQEQDENEEDKENENEQDVEDNEDENVVEDIEDNEDEDDKEDNTENNDDIKDVEEEEEEEPTPPIMPEPPVLVDVSVTKEWVGEPLEEVEVLLLRDNKPFKKATLNTDNNWSYVFKDLYKFDNLGNEYYYSIKETTIHEDYATKYEEIDDYEWKVVNILKEDDTKEDIDDEAVVEDIDKDGDKDIDDEQDDGTLEDDTKDDDVITDDTDNNNDDTTKDNIPKGEEEHSNDDIKENTDSTPTITLPKTGERNTWEYVALGVVLILIAIIVKVKEN